MSKSFGTTVAWVIAGSAALSVAAWWSNTPEPHEGVRWVQHLGFDQILTPEATQPAQTAAVSCNQEALAQWSLVQVPDAQTAHAVLFHPQAGTRRVGVGERIANGAFVQTVGTDHVVMACPSMSSTYTLSYGAPAVATAAPAPLGN